MQDNNKKVSPEDEALARAFENCSQAPIGGCIGEGRNGLGVQFLLELQKLKSASGDRTAPAATLG